MGGVQRRECISPFCRQGALCSESGLDYLQTPQWSVPCPSQSVEFSTLSSHWQSHSVTTVILRDSWMPFIWISNIWEPARHSDAFRRTVNSTCKHRHNTHVSFVTNSSRLINNKLHLYNTFHTLRWSLNCFPKKNVPVVCVQCSAPDVCVYVCERQLKI